MAILPGVSISKPSLAGLGQARGSGGGEQAVAGLQPRQGRHVYRKSSHGFPPAPAGAACFGEGRRAWPAMPSRMDCERRKCSRLCRVEPFLDAIRLRTHPGWPVRKFSLDFSGKREAPQASSEIRSAFSRKPIRVPARSGLLRSRTRKECLNPSLRSCPLRPGTGRGPASPKPRPNPVAVPQTWLDAPLGDLAERPFPLDLPAPAL